MLKKVYVRKTLRRLLARVYKEYDQTETVTLAPIASGWTNPSWGYALITAPNTVPANAWAELISTSGWGFLVRMGNQTTPSYRFIAINSTSGERTLTLRWHWH